MMNAIIKFLVKILAGGNDFKNLFLYNEFNDLTGKSRKSIIALSLILALTFCALGYSVGGIKYLKAKMDDPFTNWVTMNVKPSYKEKIPSLIHHFDAQANKDSFNLDNISEYLIDHFLFQNLEDNGFYNKKIRTIDPNERLLQEILHEKNNNVVAGLTYNDGDELEIPKCGIILKESAMINSLGYSDIKSLKRIPFIRGEYLIYADVIAVVKELPDLSEGLVTNHFYNVLYKDYSRTGFISTNSTNKFTFHGKINPKKADTFEDDFRKELEGLDLLSTTIDKFEVSEEYQLDQVVAYSSNYYELDTLKDIAKLLIEKKLMTTSQLYIPSNCAATQTFAEIDNPYYLAFNFSKLDKVRDFNNYIKSDPRFLMEITMDQVESKENFALVSRLTSFIAIILLIFSFLSIVFYINSLLTKHLEKIKQNLGTLKAFGLNNKFLVSTYVGIILMFMILSVIIGFLISMVISYIEKLTFKIPIIDLLDYRIYIAIFIILLISVLTSFNSIKKILLKTPGDLIYNR